MTGKGSRVRIGIITDSLDGENVGLTSYARNLVKNLLEIDKEREYTLVHLREHNDELYAKAKEIVVPPFPFSRTIGPKYLTLPLRLKGEKCDIIHETSHFFSIPFFPRSKGVITVHDVIPLSCPELYGRVVKWYYQHLLIYTLQSAKKIITISQHSKREIQKFYAISPEKIKVIPYGLDRGFKPDEKMNDTRTKYGLDDPFILFVGSFERRKNIPTLIKAFHKAKNKGLDHKLVIVGSKHDRFRRERNRVLAITKKLKLEKNVVLTGYIPPKELPAIYSAADLFVFPSLYEGFGLPPLEAMACGTPVIASNTTSLPEVVGYAGILINPNNINELTNAIHEVLGNEELKECLIKRGLERAKAFSWERSARETLKVYDEIICK